MRSSSKVAAVATILLWLAAASFGRAASVDDLRAKSASLSDQIKQLDAEILAINRKLTTTTSQKISLKNELAKIETTRQKLLTELSKTAKQIQVSTNNIAILSTEIGAKENNIDRDQLEISESLRSLANLETDSLLEIAFAGGDLSDILERTETLNQLSASLVHNIKNLRTNKADLENKRSTTEQEKKLLTGLKEQLNDQKQLVEETKKEKNTLLTQTSNQESAYQKMLADRLAKKKAVEEEMADIERQIKIAIDPSSLPKTGTGILSWPLSKVIITQYFGNTAFATKNSQVYNGKGHNGIDLGIPIGNKVTAAATGVVVGTGDTDKTCQGASYGKWVLVRHDNGLSTLYAHLSVIKAVPDQAVTRGDLVGYSGNTGYSTGPHLHFTVYASAGVQIQSVQSKVRGCGTYRMPVASYNAYLNPMSFLGAKP
jgi:murein DD-endopeptidase MepM/ murein hydrolase activator NlpD